MFKILTLLISFTLFFGCASQSAKMAHKIKNDKDNQFTSKASEMSEECGGEAIDNKKIAQDVAVNGSLGFLLQGTNIAIYPGGEEVPVSTAAEATRN